MLDDETFIFSRLCIHVYIAYTHELWFFLLLVCSYGPFELCPATWNPKSEPIATMPC